LEKRLRENSGGAPYALGTSSNAPGIPGAVTTTGCWVVACAEAELFELKNVRAAHPTGRINFSRPTPEKKNIFIKRDHDYKIVIKRKTIFEVPI
jgi:hypothetical protein